MTENLSKTPSPSNDSPSEDSSNPESVPKGAKGAEDITAADDILRQFHPELFHKRKLETGDGKTAKVNAAKNAAAKAKLEKTKKKVAPIHGGPTRKKKARSFFSVSDIGYHFVNFVRDLVDLVATGAAKSFIRYIINIYTAIAFVVLAPVAYMGYSYMNQPPHFLTDECYDSFTKIHEDYYELRSVTTSKEQWDEFVEESEAEIEEMVYNLNKTSTVQKRERQVLLWIGDSYLLPMVKKRDGDVAAEEERYQEFLAEIKRIRRDNESLKNRERY